jgi:hypothetical protein
MDCLNTFKLSMLFTEPYEFLLLAFFEDFSSIAVLSRGVFKSRFSQGCCFSDIMGYSDSEIIV